MGLPNRDVGDTVINLLLILLMKQTSCFSRRSSVAHVLFEVFTDAARLRVWLPLISDTLKMAEAVD